MASITNKINVLDLLKAPLDNGLILKSSFDNIEHFIQTSENKNNITILEELIANEKWSELNDRFYKKIKFGTGGLRGRTIGNFATATEVAQHIPCIGTATMNYYNVSKAMQGLIKYLQINQKVEKPKIVIAHDTRHFSSEFTKFSAKIALDLGCDVYLFSNDSQSSDIDNIKTLPRSTPHLSFTVRSKSANAGIVFTASHNPPHDNGFKVYFNDGGQVVEPYASGIIKEVNAIESDNYSNSVANEKGNLNLIAQENDKQFIENLSSLVIDKDIFKSDKKLKIVYTNLHGTGGQIIPKLLESYNINCITVPEQDSLDGNFPTVKSPNPENAEALELAVKLAKSQNADLLIGTDPDCDRMAVAIKNNDGEFVIISGNQIGSLLAFYRLQTFFKKGILNKDNAKNAVIIKTFVTTDLQAQIANHFNVSYVNTLTGFKYIGAKLQKYELQLPEQYRKEYKQLSVEKCRDLSLKYSKFYVFGGEESFGYLGSDSIRDKDGNGSTLMFAELAQYAKNNGKNILEILDEIYCQLGYFKEQLFSLIRPGASGAQEIQKLIDSYLNDSPEFIGDNKVTSVKDFSKGDLIDEEGDKIPVEKLLIINLENNLSFAVRPSGTEPKIKFYLNVNILPSEKEINKNNLGKIKEDAQNLIDSLWADIQEDVEQRINS